jgi:hypothetical protein
VPVSNATAPCPDATGYLAGALRYALPGWGSLEHIALADHGPEISGSCGGGTERPGKLAPITTTLGSLGSDHEVRWLFS